MPDRRHPPLGTHADHMQDEYECPDPNRTKGATVNMERQ
jgi:hypothetical protein